MKPAHTSTIEVSRKDMARGAREESYQLVLHDWREGKTSDEMWEQMRKEDPEFRAWLWRMGVQ